MRIVLITVIVVLTAALINWIRGGAGFPIAHVLPWMGGDAPDIFDLAAAVIIGITICGLRRMYSSNGRNDRSAIRPDRRPCDADYGPRPEDEEDDRHVDDETR